MTTLVVTDAHGARDSAHVHIAAGNQPPTVGIDVVESNKSFFFPGVPVQFTTRVSDREDGTLESGRIPASQVLVTAEYVKDGAVTNGGTLSVGAAHQAGLRLIQASGDCLACHQIDRKSIGPAYTAVAHKYHGDSSAVTRLVRKIRGGGSGVWGNVMMPAHPQLSETEAAEMVGYILSLADAKPTAASLPVHGSYMPPSSQDSTMQGAVVLRVAYSDRGANGAPPASAEQSLVLRAPTLVVATGEMADGVQKYSGPEVPVAVTIGGRSGAFIGFKQLDLTGVSAIVFAALAPTPQLNAAGGKVEVHVDSATGPLVGETPAIAPSATMGAPSLLQAPISASGVHDLFFVFRNPDAPAGQSLFVLVTATFVHGAAP
jgi:cytochrome c